jgi:hypothetical protein
MLLRESLRVAEDCLRWWSNARALATPGAPVFLVGVGGALATTFATWKQPEWAKAELATRRALRFPPAVRVASVTASHAAVARAPTPCATWTASTSWAPRRSTTTVERAIVRFDYAAGARVARELRAEMIRVATERRRPVAGRAPRRPPVLRVRFDDPRFPRSRRQWSVQKLRIAFAGTPSAAVPSLDAWRRARTRSSPRSRVPRHRSVAGGCSRRRRWRSRPSSRASPSSRRRGSAMTRRRSSARSNPTSA